MDRFDDDTLFAELREMRPTPRPQFAADLDQRAAAGFPRGADTTASVFAPLVDWWQGMSPVRRLAPAFTAALAVVVIATAAVAISQSGGGSSVGEDATLGMVTPDTSSSQSSGAVEESSEAAGEAAAAPRHSQAHHGGAGAGHGIPEYEVEVPRFEAEVVPSHGGQKSSKGAGQESSSAGAAMGGAAQTEYGAEEAESEEEEVGGESEEEASAGADAGAGSTAAGRGRNIERSSYIVLGTEPDDVSGAAAKVFEAVHAADGFVLDSSVQSGTTGATGARFELSIPTAKVDDALAAISSIAEVRERHDATDDITAPTVSAAEELADVNAAIDGLLKQLGEVETEAEQESVEARLREERRHHAAIRSSLDHLHQRASMSEVSVRIVTDHGAGVTPPTKDDGDWGVGDALHDASKVLTIAASVALIGLAVLAPLALLALIFWAGNRFRVRRLRERTLG
jgi:Domain of unknown function (DUF4349)